MRHNLGFDCSGQVADNLSAGRPNPLSAGLRIALHGTVTGKIIDVNHPDAVSFKSNRI